MTITFEPIGHISSPFQDIEGMPIQPSGAKDIIGKAIVDESFAEGLTDLDGFSHIILLYHFHRSTGYAMKVKPFLDTMTRGLFATRAPRRPNPIGISVVRLTEIKGNILYLQGVDILDGTPIIDIKPYVPAFDAPESNAIGWMACQVDRTETVTSDGRFKGSVRQGPRRQDA